MDADSGMTGWLVHGLDGWRVGVMGGALVLAGDRDQLEKVVADRGARLVVEDLAVPGEPRHDPDLLAAAFARIVDEG